MKFATLHTRAALGLEAPLVTVEVQLYPGMPRFSIAGLPETAVRESRDRVRAAFANNNFELPQHCISVHLGPAELPKQGGRYDLAIALGILAASGQIPAEAIKGHEYYGELSLSGELRAITAVLSAGLKAAAAGTPVIVPCANADEATLVRNLVVLPAATLLDVTAHLHGHATLSPAKPRPYTKVSRRAEDLADVKGQPVAKRALEIAASGGHHLLFTGPPGSGKSMLARRLPGLLPSLSEAEALEHACVESLLGFDPGVETFLSRPFRSPHHTASAVALIGGGSPPRPGEVSRAHRGVLFLDELPEFSRHVLEVLREPLEGGVITISRAVAQTDFPADFQLIAAMNPCPCGFFGDAERECRCTPDQIARYRSKISGPLLDRIDMRVSVDRIAYADLQACREAADNTAVVAARVAAARRLQNERGGCLNASLPHAVDAPVCKLDDAGHALMAKAVERFALSPRSVERVLRVGRTIADLAGQPAIAAAHLAEAMSLRTGFDESGA